MKANQIINVKLAALALAVMSVYAIGVIGFIGLVIGSLHLFGVL